jgi:1-acyl-sn-glycerol-3-phosphate acyltransferase
MKKYLFKIWGKSIIWVFGWKVDQQLKADFRRCVMIAAPHTSNWDFVIARAAFEVMEIPVRFTIKKEWTEGVLGWLLRSLGAIPIDRNPKNAREKGISYVDAMTQLFGQYHDLAVLITPEGTRSKQEEWKTGFYHVAKKAGVPIALGYLDFKTKTAGIGKVLFPGDDLEADMKSIMAFYQNIAPKYPENFSIDKRFEP